MSLEDLKQKIGAEAAKILKDPSATIPATDLTYAQAVQVSQRSTVIGPDDIEEILLKQAIQNIPLSELLKSLV